MLFSIQEIGEIGGITKLVDVLLVLANAISVHDEDFLYIHCCIAEAELHDVGRTYRPSGSTYRNLGVAVLSFVFNRATAERWKY